MDMKVPAEKIGLTEKYHLLTRDLSWDPSYQTEKDIFPYGDFEGIKIHDWDKWDDPFRLTVDSYWKYQAEKERKYYAIIDAHAQNNGHLNITDARYLSALKMFLQAISPQEYAAHRGFARVAREYQGVGASVACEMQSIDEIRHAQTQVHAMSNYNKFYNGFHGFAYQRDRMWYGTVPRSFFDDAMTAGPFEFIIAIGFSFEYVLTNLLFVPFMSGAAYNGDMATVTFGFSAQSDEARHMTLGLECIKFMLEQDPDNIPIVQAWLDKWFWRGMRLLGLVGTMMDYMLPKRVMSWKEAWQIYGEENGEALFRDLARYGIRKPRGWEQAAESAEHVSHQIMLGIYQYRFGTAFHAAPPTEEEMDWLSQKYPNTFDKYYRPRWEHIKKTEAETGEPFLNFGLPKLCQTCQLPTWFTDPGDPTKHAQHECEFEGETYHFCSEGCQHIFEHEPQKFSQGWLPIPALIRDFGENIPGWMEWVHLNPNVDNMSYAGSQDEANFNAWKSQVSESSK